jgi:hypothetical protein
MDAAMRHDNDGFVPEHAPGRTSGTFFKYGTPLFQILSRIVSRSLAPFLVSDQRLDATHAQPSQLSAAPWHSKAHLCKRTHALPYRMHWDPKLGTTVSVFVSFFLGSYLRLV